MRVEVSGFFGVLRFSTIRRVSLKMHLFCHLSLEAVFVVVEGQRRCLCIWDSAADVHNNSHAVHGLAKLDPLDTSATVQALQ